LDSNLQRRVEDLEKKVKELQGKLEDIVEAISHGRITELKKESEGKQHLKIQVEDNQSGLSDSPPRSSKELTVKWTHINK
jgi:hypothetical protein